MMPIFAENSTEQIKLRKARNQFNQEQHHHHHHHQQQQQQISIETDPNPCSTRSSKSTISSIFLSPFSANDTVKKKGGSFRGLGGCTAGAAQQVSVPAVIRSSAEWEGKRMKKKKHTQLSKRKKDAVKEQLAVENNSNSHHNNNDNNVDGGGGGGGNSNNNGGNCMVIQDVWCGPGIGFSGADAVVGSVDCVVARKNVNVNVNNVNSSSSSSGRGKIDVDKIHPRERERDRERERPFVARRAAVNPESLAFLDSDPAFVTSRPEPEVFGNRYYRHVRHPSPDGLAEIMMLQNSLIMGGRLDRFSSWRLDIDHMTYEQLLELSDRIGYVSTGLKDNEICHCVRKIKLPIVNDQSKHLPIVVDKKCSICQEEYEADDELGKLECGHGFHLQCIRQWLAHKNICPVCKTAPVARG